MGRLFDPTATDPEALPTDHLFTGLHLLTNLTLRIGFTATWVVKSLSCMSLARAAFEHSFLTPVLRAGSR